MLLWQGILIIFPPKRAVSLTREPTCEQGTGEGGSRRSLLQFYTKSSQRGMRKETRKVLEESQVDIHTELEHKRTRYRPEE